MQQRGFTKLVGLNYEIQYHKGTDNKVVDALSRCVSLPDIVVCVVITTVIPTWVQKCNQATRVIIYV